MATVDRRSFMGEWRGLKKAEALRGSLEKTYRLTARFCGTLRTFTFVWENFYGLLALLPLGMRDEVY